MTAATAGGNIAAAAPIAVCAATTTGSVGMKYSSTHPAATTAAATAIVARFYRMRSINAPAGVWASTVPICDAASAIPTRPASQW